MSATKNRRKYNQHFKLLFFKINLHYGTSVYISTYGKLNLLPINSIFFVFPSRVMQRRLMQTKAYYKISLFSLKRSASKAFQSSRRKRVLPKCVYHWYNLLRWMFFIPCDNSKQYFFTQIYCYSEAWCNCHAAAFFQASVLKEVHVLYPLSPHKY